VVLLASEEGLSRWEWARHLPHMWDDEQRLRFLICGKAAAHQTFSELYGVLKERESRALEGSALPHYVFIVEDPSLLDNEAINKYLYNGSSSIGVSTMFIAKHTSLLPMNCKTVITLQNHRGELVDRSSGEKVLFVPDKTELKHLDLMARKLAALRIKQSGTHFALPSSI
ncbi:hypothetical protein U6X42_12375, partial [Cutibacterium acnes]